MNTGSKISILSLLNGLKRLQADNPPDVAQLVVRLNAFNFALLADPDSLVRKTAVLWVFAMLRRILDLLRTAVAADGGAPGQPPLAIRAPLILKNNFVYLALQDPSLIRDDDINLRVFKRVVDRQVFSYLLKTKNSNEELSIGLEKEQLEQLLAFPTGADILPDPINNVIFTSDALLSPPQTCHPLLSFHHIAVPIPTPLKETEVARSVIPTRPRFTAIHHIPEPVPPVVAHQEECPSDSSSDDLDVTLPSEEDLRAVLTHKSTSHGTTTTAAQSPTTKGPKKSLRVVSVSTKKADRLGSSVSLLRVRDTTKDRSIDVPRRVAEDRTFRIRNSSAKKENRGSVRNVDKPALASRERTRVPRLPEVPARKIYSTAKQAEASVVPLEEHKPAVKKGLFIARRKASEKTGKY